jgi:gluconate kinase
MSSSMLDSQLAALEPPVHALKVDVAQTPEEIVAHIRQNLGI